MAGMLLSSCVEGNGGASEYLVKNCPKNDALLDHFFSRFHVNFNGLTMYAQQSGEMIGATDDELKQAPLGLRELQKNPSQRLIKSKANVDISICPDWSPDAKKPGLYIQRGKEVVDENGHGSYHIDMDKLDFNNSKLSFVVVEQSGKIHIFEKNDVKLNDNWAILIISQGTKAIIAWNPYLPKDPRAIKNFYDKTNPNKIIYKKVFFRNRKSSWAGIKEIRTNKQQ